MDSRSSLGQSFDSEDLFRHPDQTLEIDSRLDPVREISDELFAMGPVVRGRGYLTGEGAKVQFGNVVLPNILIPADACEGDCFVAVTWDAVRTVYLNPKTFSNRIFEKSVGPFWGPALTTLDPPEHTKYRAIMERGFTPKYIKSYEDSIIRPVLAERFRLIRDRGRADLVRDLNCFYPYEVVGGIVGFDPADVGFVASCFNRIWLANINPGAAFEAGNALKDYSRKLIESRRKTPKEDLVSAMLNSEVDGEPLRDLNFVAMVNHLMAGGIDTTYKQSGDLVHALLSHPDQFDAVKQNRELVPNAVEESLRFEGVGGIIARQAVEDTELCGVPIPRGSIVFILHGVSNRDASRWTDPHTFDVTRPRQAHMQFSNGAHSCIGQHLARFMLGRYLEHLIDDLPDLRWDPALTTPPKITGWTQRTPLTLPVVWNI
jgi:cytochrome P450